MSISLLNKLSSGQVGPGRGSNKDALETRGVLSQRDQLGTNLQQDHKHLSSGGREVRESWQIGVDGMGRTKQDPKCSSSQGENQGILVPSSTFSTMLDPPCEQGGRKTGVGYASCSPHTWGGRWGSLSGCPGPTHGLMTMDIAPPPNTGSLLSSGAPTQYCQMPPLQGSKS